LDRVEPDMRHAKAHGDLSGKAALAGTCVPGDRHALHEPIISEDGPALPCRSVDGAPDAYICGMVVRPQRCSAPRVLCGQ